MHTRRIAKLVGLCAWLAAGRLPAATPAPDKEAQARATLYQTEAHAEMRWMHWRIITDAPGRLVGTRSLPTEHAGGETRGYRNLIVTFRAVSKTDTECGINQVVCRYMDSSNYGFHKKFVGPVALTDERSIREVNELLTRARQRMLKLHPEFASPSSH